MEPISKPILDEVGFLLPVNMKDALKCGSLTTYEAMQRMGKTINAVVGAVDTNTEKMDEFNDELVKNEEERIDNERVRVLNEQKRREYDTMIQDALNGAYELAEAARNERFEEAEAVRNERVEAAERAASEAAERADAAIESAERASERAERASSSAEQANEYAEAINNKIEELSATDPDAAAMIARLAEETVIRQTSDAAMNERIEDLEKEISSKLLVFDNRAFYDHRLMVVAGDTVLALNADGATEMSVVPNSTNGITSYYMLKELPDMSADTMYDLREYAAEGCIRVATQQKKIDIPSDAKWILIQGVVNGVYYAPRSISLDGVPIDKTIKKAVADLARISEVNTIDINNINSYIGSTSTTVYNGAFNDDVIRHFNGAQNEKIIVVEFTSAKKMEVIASAQRNDVAYAFLKELPNFNINSTECIDLIEYYSEGCGRTVNHVRKFEVDVPSDAKGIIFFKSFQNNDLTPQDIILDGISVYENLPQAIKKDRENIAILRNDVNIAQDELKRPVPAEYNRIFNDLKLSNYANAKILVLNVEGVKQLKVVPHDDKIFTYALVKEILDFTVPTTIDIEPYLVKGGKRVVTYSQWIVDIPADAKEIVIFSKFQNYDDRTPKDILLDGVSIYGSLWDAFAHRDKGYIEDFSEALKRQNEACERIVDDSVYGMIPFTKLVLNSDNILTRPFITPTQYKKPDAYNPDTSMCKYWRADWNLCENEQGYDWRVLDEWIRECAENNTRFFFGLSLYGSNYPAAAQIDNKSNTYISYKTTCDKYLEEHGMSFVNGGLMKDGLPVKCEYPVKYFWRQVIEGEPVVYRLPPYNEYHIGINYDYDFMVQAIKDLYSAMHSHLKNTKVNGVEMLYYIESFRMSALGIFGEGWYRYDIVSDKHAMSYELASYIVNLFDEVRVGIPWLSVNNYSDSDKDKLREFFSLSNSQGLTDIFCDTIWGFDGIPIYEKLKSLGLSDLLQGRRITGEVYVEGDINYKNLFFFNYELPCSLVPTVREWINNKFLTPAARYRMVQSEAIMGAHMYIRHAMMDGNDKLMIDLQNVGTTKIFSIYWDCMLYYKDKDGNILGSKKMELDPREIEPVSMDYESSGVVKRDNEYHTENVNLPIGTKEIHFCIKDRMGIYENYWLHNKCRTEDGMYPIVELKEAYAG